MRTAPVPTTGRAIVVGGGPAGSLAALLLARRGWAVELLEQHRFPRDKVCGECLSALGLATLERRGLIPRLSALNPTELVRTLIHPADGPPLDLPLPRPMWGLTRFALDREMLAAAAEAGVVVRQPARCERVVGGPRPLVEWRDLGTNRVQTSDADWVVLADGKGALFPSGSPPPTGDLGIKAHFEGVDGPRDTIELFAGPGCYGGLAAVEGGRWNAAFSLPQEMIRRHGGVVDAAFDEVVAFNPVLAGRLRVARRIGRWLAAPLPRFAVRTDWPERVVPVGNAAAALEPIGGEGMGLALRSAELAVARIVALRGTAGGLTANYNSLWRVRRAACRGVACVVSRPGWAGRLTALIQSDNPATRLGMRCMGKTGG